MAKRKKPEPNPAVAGEPSVGAATPEGIELARLVCAQVEVVELADLVHDPVNARQHPERNLQAIAASLKQFGQDQPLVVQRQGKIVRKGNGRMAAMRQMGWTKAAVVWVDDDNWQAVARALADNRSAELATWDNAVLGQLLRGMADEPGGTPPEELGWTADEVKAIKAFAQGAPGDGGSGEAPGENGFQYGGKYAVIVTCTDEAHQKKVYDELSAAGHEVKVVVV